MSRTIKWGVISTANIGRVAVIPAIQTCNGSELVAVASRDLPTANAFADKLDIRKRFGSYDELITDPEIDSLYVPLPNTLHAEWVIKALRAGKHVLCEKPLAVTADECRQMESVAARNKVHLMEAFMYRFHPRTERVIAMVKSGALGRLSAIEASFTFRLRDSENIRFSAELGGGALMDVGCYCVNVIRTLVGEEPETVSGVAIGAETGVDGRFAGVLKFPGGVLAHFDCSLLDERRERYIVAGEDAFLEVGDAFIPGSDECQIREIRGRGNETVHRIAGVDEYRLMVEHFAECVRNDTPPRYSAAEAAANMEVIQALKESARRGGQMVIAGTP